MSRDKLTYLEIIIIISERILNSFSHLKPSKKEDELQNKEYWNECVGVFLKLLASNEGQGKEHIHSKLHNLRTKVLKRKPLKNSKNLSIKGR